MSGFSPTNCPQHHLCAPALATPTAAHLPWSRCLTRKHTSITFTVPLSPATAQSTSLATQYPTPRLYQASHPTHLQSTLLNSQCTTLAHQPHPPSSPQHQHQHPRCPLSRSRRSSRTRTLTRLRLSSLLSPRPGNTTTTSRPPPQPRTSRTTTAISAVHATRLSRALPPCASTRTRTLARSPSAARMPAAVRLSPCAVT